MTRRLRSRIPVWLTTLLLVATGASIVVTVVEVLGLYYAYAGGRVRGVGFTWIFRILALQLDIDPASRLPAVAGRYYELRDGWQLLGFLWAAAVVNTVFSWLMAAAAAPIYRHTAGLRASLPALWLLFLSPTVLHIACEAPIALPLPDAYRYRAPLGLAILLALWALLSWRIPRAAVTRLVRGASVVGLGLGALIAAGAGLNAVTPAARSPAPPATGLRPNILLISIDSLRADHVAAYGYARETSPAIDALAQQGVRFVNAVAPTSWTLPSHMTMLTAMPQQQHQVYKDGRRLSSGVDTLTEKLSRAGYATSAFVSGPYLRAEYGFHQGFDSYDDYSALTLVNQAHSAVTSPDLLNAARRRLDDWAAGGRDRPFFIFLHMWDVHFDYVPPSPYDQMFDPGYRGPIDGRDVFLSDAVNREMDRADLDHLIALYDGEIRFTDHHIGLLVAHLETLRALDDTIVVVTADHGEGFFEHGGKGHRSALYDEQVRVPLVMRYPAKIPGARVVPEQVRLLDLMPTLLSLAGIPLPRSPVRHGPTDLTPLIDRPEGGKGRFPPLTAFGRLEDNQLLIRTGRWKLLWNRAGGRPPGLFDLMADPGERRNLGLRQPRVVAGFRQAHRAFEQAFAPQAGPENVRMDGRHIEVLRSLGYVK